MFALVDGAPDEYCVELVGADALEGILWRAGDAVIDAIEAEAISNPRLRRALWTVDGLHDQPLIEARVRRILKDEPRPQTAQRPTDWPELPDER